MNNQLENNSEEMEKWREELIAFLQNENNKKMDCYGCIYHVGIYEYGHYYTSCNITKLDHDNKGCEKREPAKVEPEKGQVSIYLAGRKAGQVPLKEVEKSGWIAKLDEFMDRQGIKSAELCKIMDGLEKEIQSLKSQVESSQVEIDNLKGFWKPIIEKFETKHPNAGNVNTLALTALAEAFGIHCENEKLKANLLLAVELVKNAIPYVDNYDLLTDGEDRNVDEWVKKAQALVKLENTNE